MGWARLTNGTLLKAAEEAAFEVFVTTDKNLKHQQNLGLRQIAIIVSPTTRWSQIRAHANAVADAVNNAKPGSFLELSW
jgi:hypothetical protein